MTPLEPKVRAKFEKCGEILPRLLASSIGTMQVEVFRRRHKTDFIRVSFTSNRQSLINVISGLKNCDQLGPKFFALLGASVAERGRISDHDQCVSGPRKHDIDAFR